MMTEAADSPEMFVMISQTTRCQVPGDSTLSAQSLSW